MVGGTRPLRWRSVLVCFFPQRWWIIPFADKTKFKKNDKPIETQKVQSTHKERWASENFLQLLICSSFQRLLVHCEHLKSEVHEHKLFGVVQSQVRSFRTKGGAGARYGSEFCLLFHNQKLFVDQPLLLVAHTVPHLANTADCNHPRITRTHFTMEGHFCEICGSDNTHPNFLSGKIWSSLCLTHNKTCTHVLAHPYFWCWNLVKKVRVMRGWLQ